MQKITINDFSGGIQESTVPDDFTARQWAELKGVIPSSELNFESQWGIQTVGSSATGFQAVYPLVCSAGTFLVGIKTTGTLWWCTVPAVDAAYTTANAVSWTQITQAENYNADGDAKISIVSNTDYKFICSVPLPVYKYAKTPTGGSLTNSSKDTYTGSVIEVASSVLLNSTTLNGSSDGITQQAVVLYVDTSVPSVKAVTFPNVRRAPMHDADAGDYIKAKVDSAGTLVPFPTWFTGTSPFRAFHPYTYLDKFATLLPGRGIIPRANVGTMKGSILMLGDIEWRSDEAGEATYQADAYLTTTGGSDTFGTGSAEAVFPVNIPTDARVIYNEGSGIIYVKNDTYVSATVSNKESSSGTATLTTAGAHGYTAGDKVDIVNVDSLLNGTHTIVATPSSVTFTVASGATITSTAVSAGKSYSYKYRVEVGAYQTIPNSWTSLYVAASVADTKIKAVANLNTAYFLLNDGNTGPHRGGIYFSTGGDIDMFDPRAVLIPGKTDVAIAGMHVLDDTVIIVTTAGSALDGVFRIRGYLSRVIQYGGTSDPTAIRIELVRGGIGAPRRTTKLHKNYSTSWSEAGVVVFIDRLGGIWYTNGQDCDRLDRYGPKSPNVATEDDHVAEFGKHLFAWRDGRLLCFTIMASDQEDRSGTGCWTELVLNRSNGTPFGVRSMVGARSEMFFIATDTGNVMRMSPSGLGTERGKIDNNNITITVSTLTAGEVSNHKRTNWHKFGMTFTTPTSCTVGTVRVQSTGALNISGSASPPDVQYLSTLNRTYSDKGILGEFIVNAGIGPQASCSATVTFTGYVQLQSASFWVSGQTPRIGDK
jgi:hypothetical protein